MDEPLLATIIGVSGTVLVGVTGFGVSIWNTRKTISSDRNARMAELRIEAYVDSIAAISQRHIRRHVGTRTTPLPPDAQQRGSATLTQFKPPDWQRLGAPSRPTANRKSSKQCKTAPKPKSRHGQPSPNETAPLVPRRAHQARRTMGSPQCGRVRRRHCQTPGASEAGSAHDHEGHLNACEQDQSAR